MKKKTVYEGLDGKTYDTKVECYIANLAFQLEVDITDHDFKTSLGKTIENGNKAKRLLKLISGK